MAALKLLCCLAFVAVYGKLVSGKGAVVNCPKYAYGDGEPGKELKFMNVKGSDCAAHCMKQKNKNPKITAATIKNGKLSQKGCWCQVGATYNDGDKKYQTCFFAEGKRCGGIDNGCCTKAKPCGEGDGDCDNNSHCKGGLVCGVDNCPWGNYDDCCMKKKAPLRCKGIDNKCCTKKNPCGQGDGDCDSDAECKKGMMCGVNNCGKYKTWVMGQKGDDCCVKVPAGLRCKGIDNGCCTNAKPCIEGDGDCDYHSHCKGDLICGTDNCAWGGDGDDCCIKVPNAKALRCKGIDNGCCTKAKPCIEGDGDCDYHSHCKGDLLCGTDNCAWGGGGDDCCTLRCNGIDNGCCTKAKPCIEGDGDCDYHSHCKGDLLCGTDNCAWGGGGDDCCIKVPNAKALRCKGIDNGCCTKAKPCIEGDGDCDYDSHCAKGLKCHNALNNCPWGGNGDDCCIKDPKYVDRQMVTQTTTSWEWVVGDNPQKELVETEDMAEEEE